MLTTDFYKILHDEVLATAEKNKTLPLLKNERDERARKSKAFMLWFLSFYSQQPIFQEHITDGDGDGSCDMIFSNRDSTGENVFYIVQAKWINMEFGADGKLTKRPEQYTKIDKEEFNAVLTDFAAVLNGSRQPTKNAVFNAKYQELKLHLKENGRAKFIFFTAADDNDSIKESIISFNHDQAPNVTLELMDINRIKTDFINTRYKQIVTNNPLEYVYSAEDDVLSLPIEAFEVVPNNRNLLQYEGDATAYVFLLRPETIYKLFKKYKFGLFYKNVRNPLPESNYNEEIVQTLLNRPSAFWYFNNGITAITKHIPTIGKHSEIISNIRGIQIINGAQTVYSIYRAYQAATYNQRDIMNSDARIMFRLIRSSNTLFNLEITRFTNQQNQILSRDFIANDDVQERLQQESFATNYWYERRRGEFRNIDNVQIVVLSNYQFAVLYLAFWLQIPLQAMQSEEALFSAKSNIYKQVFNAETNFKDGLAAYMIWTILSRKRNQPDFYSQGQKDDSERLLILQFALMKIALEKYLAQKYPVKPRQLTAFVLKSVLEDSDFELKITRLFAYINKITANTQQAIHVLHDASIYLHWAMQLNYATMTTDDINDIDGVSQREG
jgi:hypothetical protein